MADNNILEQSLDQLERHSWGECQGEPTLVLECNRLRHIPLKELTPADLSVMIAQFIGLDYLIPLALKVLDSEPLLQAGDFPGDLLENVMAIDLTYWEDHPEQGRLIRDIVTGIDLDHLTDMRMRKLIGEFL